VSQPQLVAVLSQARTTCARRISSSTSGSLRAASSWSWLWAGSPLSLAPSRIRMSSSEKPARFATSMTPESAQRLVAVAALAGHARRRGEESLGLVVADGRHVQVGAVRDFADREI